MADSDDTSDLSILENIVSRPALFWGNSDNHFHSFVAFVSGYQTAFNDLLEEKARLELEEIIPPGFHEFVTEYYGHTFPHGGYGWSSFIEENTESGEEALALFLKLRRLYDERHGDGESSNGDLDPDAS